MEERTSVLVVGGGLAGLAAAAFAARTGAAVRLLEKSGEPGGRARTRDVQGFLFNVGPHALYRRGAGIGVLRELGVPIHGRVPPNRGLGLLGGRTQPLPVGMRSLLATRLLSPLSKLQFARALARLQRGSFVTRPGQTLEGWLAGQGLREDARQLLRALVRVATYSHDPRIDAGAALAQVQAAVSGSVLYLDGGWQPLVAGLRRAAADAGAEVVTGARAEALVTDAGGVRGVRDSEGRLHAADAVILAVPPAEAARLAGAASPSLREAAATAVPVRAACLDVGLRALPRPQNTFALGIDRPCYLSVHSATARLAPAGGALIHVLRYLGDDRPHPAQAERELEDVLDRLQPGWRDQVQARRFVPELVVAHDSPRAGGLAARAPVVVPDVPGLLLAGDWVGHEGLLADASLASARQAARAAVRDTRERAA